MSNNQSKYIRQPVHPSNLASIPENNNFKSPKGMEWFEIAQQLHHNELVNLLICNFDNICRLCILYLFYQKYILMVKISTFVFGIRWKLNRSCEIMGFSTWLYSRFSLKFVILPIEPFRPTLTILLPNSHPRKAKCQILLKANYYQ